MAAAADKTCVHWPGNGQPAPFQGKQAIHDFFHGTNMNLALPSLRNAEPVKVCRHDIIDNEVLKSADQLVHIAWQFIEKPGVLPGRRKFRRTRVEFENATRWYCASSLFGLRHDPCWQVTLPCFQRDERD